MLPGFDARVEYIKYDYICIVKSTMLCGMSPAMLLAAGLLRLLAQLVGSVSNVEQLLVRLHYP